MTVFWADFVYLLHELFCLEPCGNFYHVAVVCPKCRQGANILGTSLRDCQAALNYEVTIAAIKVLRKGWGSMLSFQGLMLSITNIKCIRGTSCLQEAHSLSHSNVHAVVEGNIEGSVITTVLLCDDGGEHLLSYLGPVASRLCCACLHVWKLAGCWLGEDN